MLVNGVEYKEHHTALCKGYVLVKNNEEPNLMLVDSEKDTK